MIDIPGKFEAAFFGNMTDIKPSADTIPPFLEMFRDKGFLPTTFHEIRADSPGPSPRLRLLSPDNEWNIDFESHKIGFQKNATKPKGANIGTPKDFAKDVLDFCARILCRFPKRSNRLSLVTQGLLNEMPEERLRRIYRRVFHPFKFYSDNSPVEWNSRSVARIPLEINGNDEQVNAITVVSRIQGQLDIPNGIEPFDRIRVVFDINTFQGNVEPRFGIDSTAQFYPKALELRARLLSELEGCINE